MRDIVHRYLRPRKKFPTVWCPGCGNGIITSALVRAIDSLGLNRDEVILVSGIGCSSRAPIYLDFASFHGTHGRALAFATGIKFAAPRLTVVVISGDGDAIAIGGNHFIHAARRNIDLCVIVYNNNMYGMTGGQHSPTTPVDAFAATSPYGNIERPFDVCMLAAHAGATFVARSSVAQPLALERYIRRGIRARGFAVIDAVTPCPALYSFYNKTGTGAAMTRAIRENTVGLDAWRKMTEEERRGKIVCGVFADREDREYTEVYAGLIEKAQRERRDEEPL